MKIFYSILFYFVVLFFVQCRAGKIITKAIATRDSTKLVVVKSATDSLKLVNDAKETLHKTNIDFKTFSAKIRLDIETSKGVEPDAIAKIKMIKDSIVWISITATFLNLEVLRIYLFKDSIIVLDKQKQEVSYRKYDYLQELTNIPFTLKTVQDLLIGNAVFVNEKNFSVKKYDDYTLISTITNEFKNLITISSPENLLTHSKLDDKNINLNRTADFSYGYYNSFNGFLFSTYRQIVVTEKNKLDIRMNFKQYEFNKDLSISVSIPKNYKKK